MRNKIVHNKGVLSWFWNIYRFSFYAIAYPIGFLFFVVSDDCRLPVEGSDKVLSGCKVGAAVNATVRIRDTVRVA